jgi:hypothetical protein
MIRQPSTVRQIYQWHADALAGREPERHDGIPQAGWYRMRHVKGGPWVAVEIVCRQVVDPETGELTEDERWVARIEGREIDAAPIWIRLNPIARTDFLALCRRAETDDVMAATMVAVDLAKTPQRPPRM